MTPCIIRIDASKTKTAQSLVGPTPTTQTTYCKDTSKAYCNGTSVCLVLESPLVCRAMSSHHGRMGSYDMLANELPSSSGSFSSPLCTGLHCEGSHITQSGHTDTHACTHAHTQTLHADAQTWTCMHTPPVHPHVSQPVHSEDRWKLVSEWSPWRENSTCVQEHL